ncbi:hypothetical protein HN670_04220 [bacterium]|nr:hypothetical protein [bacterium]
MKTRILIMFLLLTLLSLTVSCGVSTPTSTKIHEVRSNTFYGYVLHKQFHAESNFLLITVLNEVTEDTCRIKVERPHHDKEDWSSKSPFAKSGPPPPLKEVADRSFVNAKIRIASSRPLRSNVIVHPQFIFFDNEEIPYIDY